MLTLEEQFENIKWKISEIRKQLSFKLHTIVSSMMKPYAIPFGSTFSVSHCFVQRTHTVYATRPLVT